MQRTDLAYSRSSKEPCECSNRVAPLSAFHKADSRFAFRHCDLPLHSDLQAGSQSRCNIGPYFRPWQRGNIRPRGREDDIHHRTRSCDCRCERRRGATQRRDSTSQRGGCCCCRRRWCCCISKLIRQHAPAPSARTIGISSLMRGKVGCNYAIDTLAEVWGREQGNGARRLNCPPAASPNMTRHHNDFFNMKIGHLLVRRHPGAATPRPWATLLPTQSFDVPDSCISIFPFSDLPKALTSQFSNARLASLRYMSHSARLRP